MILEATSYPNRIRTISGLVNFVFPDDSIILCNTSTGAVAIELAEIPANSWNTIYKVYIKDASTNATTNNITINAPVGYTINGNPSLIINQDDGVVLIRIASNTEYLGETNFGTSAGLAVLDQGVLLTANCSSMDFVGSNITATNIGNAVTVSVTNNFVTLTFAQLTNLINTNTVVPNQAYLVTDAIFGSTPPISTSIVVTGITTNRVSEQGQGIFFNADYQLVGNYSGVTGFAANLGLWSSTLLPVLGDVVIWNNFHYVNLTGLNGLANPSSDLVNWQFLSYSTTKGYILEVDTITYDQFSNQIMNRTDKRLNVVDRGLQGGFNSFNGFSWGNNKVFNNKVLGNSCVRIMNCKVDDEFSENQIYNSSLIIGDTNVQGQCSFFKANQINNSTSHFVTKASQVRNNIFNSTTFDVQNNEGNILNNQISYCQISLTSHLGDFNNNDLDQTSLDLITSSVGSAFSNNFGKVNTMLITTNTFNIIDNLFNDSNVTIGNNSGEFRKNQFTNGALTITNNLGSFTTNTFENYSLNLGNNALNGFFDANNILNIRLGITNNSGAFTYNYFDQGAAIINTNDGEISYNRFINSSFGLSTINSAGARINFNCFTESDFSIQTNNGDIGVLTGKAGGNNFESKSTLNINTNNGVVAGNYFKNNSVIGFTTINDVFSNNQGDNSQISVATLITGLKYTASIGGILSIGFPSISIGSGSYGYALPGTISCELDCSDPLVYDLATFTLTIPIGIKFFCQTIGLINCAGLTINKISNGNGFTKFRNNDGVGIVTFNSVLFAGVLPNQIVSPNGVFAYNISNTDEIVINLAAINYVISTSIIL